jgi:hypothetical protein|tara:strand:+ start:653 stop:928 length:276 start_codon:yes stop_codon:yes gene_type:complete
MFLIDIFINFNTAYQDEDFETIDDRGKIAKSYLGGWFLLDTLSIVPFDLLATGASAGNVNSLVRLTKVSRIAKMIKLTKLVRIMKVIKQRN